MARKRRYQSSVLELGYAEIEWDSDGLPILVLFGKWRESGQQRVRVRMGLSGAGEIGGELHKVPAALQTRVNNMLAALKGA